MGGNELENRFGDLPGGELGVLVKNGETSLYIGGLDVGEKPPFEATSEPILQRGEMAGMSIGGNDQLTAGLVERVERVEELFEDLLLALEELNIVEQQDVDSAVAVLEFVHTFAANPVDEVVEKILRGHVPHDEAGIDLS